MGRKLLGILLIAIIALLLALFGPWNAKKRSADMKSSIESAFAANGIENVSVDMSGNVARLSGLVGSESLLEKAKSVAMKTECETCKKKGKIWHEVESDIKVKQAPALPTASPYTFNAVKASDGGVTVKGFVRNQAESDRVTREAQAVFGSNLRSVDLKIAQGQPNENWGDEISKYMKELVTLDRGTFSMTDATSMITGETDNSAIRDRIDALASNQNLGFAERASITVKQAPVISQASCQKLFDDLKGDAKINFASAKADIVPGPSMTLLGELSNAMAQPQCASYNVIIEGHTDSEGQEAYNQWLSEQRANAVRNDLVARGVSAARISAIGYGELTPKASNDTAAGKAVNRRIEFKITTSE